MRVVCFIQGDWLSPAVWAKFKLRFEACGYSCCILSLPAAGESGWHSLLNQRRSKASDLQRLVDFYAERIDEFPVRPVLVGHALGGLIVQLLLDRGLGAAGIAIAPRPPQRVFPGVRSLLHPLLANVETIDGMRYVSITPSQFAQHAAHPMTSEMARALYDSFAVKVPQRLMLAVALGVGSKLLLSNDRMPLLFIAGGDDSMVSNSVVLSNYVHQSRSLAPTAFTSFPGFGHLLIVQPGWERVADSAIGWLQEQLERF